MAVLLIVLALIIGLSWRAGLYGRRAGVADADGQEQSDDSFDDGFLDTCARSFVVVFLCLLGLFALGVMYGNVLGATPTSGP